MTCSESLLKERGEGLTKSQDSSTMGYQVWGFSF